MYDGCTGWERDAVEAKADSGSGSDRYREIDPTTAPRELKGVAPRP